MSRSTFSLLGIALAILATFVFSTPAYAQSGTGPDDGLNFGEWRALDFNQEQWMCFDYKGDDSNIQLDVYLEPKNSADVNIRTPEEIDVWRKTGENVCIGCGSADPVAKGDLHWDGSFNIKGQYCVTIKHNRSRAETAYYRAEIVGKGVTFPAPPVMAEEPAARAMAEPAPAPAPPAAESHSMMGTGPDYAMVPGNWTELGFNETHWYVFNVEDPAADVRIELFIDGDENSADFLVRMPADVQVWRDTGQNPCIGCGTEDAFVKGDKSWRGVFNTKGLVWVTVHQTRQGDAPVYYRLVITGKKVTFPAMAAPAAPPAPVAEEVAVVRAMAAPPAPAADAAPGMMATDGPDTAMRPDDGWHEIAGGEQHWYKLPIKKNKAIEVSIFGSPADVASFTIRTAADVDVWRRTGEDPCVGCGTTNAVAKGDFFWSGQFNQDGDIWIVVGHLNRRDGAPGYYRIAVAGAGVAK